MALLRYVYVAALIASFVLGAAVTRSIYSGKLEAAESKRDSVAYDLAICQRQVNITESLVNSLRANIEAQNDQIDRLAMEREAAIAKMRAAIVRASADRAALQELEDKIRAGLPSNCEDAVREVARRLVGGRDGK